MATGLPAATDSRLTTDRPMAYRGKPATMRMTLLDLCGAPQPLVEDPENLAGAAQSGRGPIAGLWLDASVWDDVSAELRGYGHRPVQLDLRGVADRSVTATLDDQVADVVAAVDRAGTAMLVGHSAACTLAWIAADRRAEAVSRVAMVGGFPNADGEAYADFFETAAGVSLEGDRSIDR